MNAFTPFAPPRVDLGTFVKPKPLDLTPEFLMIELGSLLITLGCLTAMVVARLL